MADAPNTNVPAPDPEGPVGPEEAEHKKLFEEFAAKHRQGAATAASEDAGQESENEVESESEIAAAAEPAATGEKTVSATALIDIWAEATPAQKAAYDSVYANQQALEQYKRSNEGRVNGFQRQIDDLNKALAGRATATTSAAATAADSKVNDATKSLDSLFNSPKFVSARKEYPEIYEPLVEALGGVLAEAANLKLELGSLKSTTMSKFERDNLAKESDEIIRLDPDYVETVSRPEFQPAFDKWLESQPTKIKELVSEAANNGVKNASDTSWAFRKFKQDTGFGGGQSPATAKAAAATSTSSATDRTRRSLQVETSASVKSTRPSATPSGRDGLPAEGDAALAADWKRNVDRIKRRSQSEGWTY